MAQAIGSCTNCCHRHPSRRICAVSKTAATSAKKSVAAHARVTASVTPFAVKDSASTSSGTP